jgi:serine/threonine-protein kinase HipA
LFAQYPVLIANNDNHLKNLSFMVGREGIELPPAYDLLSTGAYHTRAFAGDRADWPKVPLAITMLNVPTLEAVNRKSLLESGEALGLRKSIGERELNSMMAAMPGALEELIHEVTDDNTRLPQAAMQFLAGELPLLATLQHLVVPEMMARLR